MMFSKVHKGLAKLVASDKPGAGRAAGMYPAMAHLRLERSSVPGADEGTGSLVATDGRMLAALPVELHDADADGAVTVEAFQAACKQGGMGRAWDLVRMEANGSLKLASGASFPRPEDQGYPEWRRILPNLPELGARDTVSVCLNPDLLAKLAAAGAGGFCTLTFRVEPEARGGLMATKDPIRITCPGTPMVLALMSCTSDDLKRPKPIAAGSEVPSL